jgi:hypothetical protein
VHLDIRFIIFFLFLFFLLRLRAFLSLAWKVARISAWPSRGSRLSVTQISSLMRPWTGPGDMWTLPRAIVSRTAPFAWTREILLVLVPVLESCFRFIVLTGKVVEIKVFYSIFLVTSQWLSPSSPAYWPTSRVVASGQLSVMLRAVCTT